MRKKFKDLIPGDIILVSIDDSGIWKEETITNVNIGEDGYEGSGRWYT